MIPSPSLSDRPVNPAMSVNITVIGRIVPPGRGSMTCPTRPLTRSSGIYFLKAASPRAISAMVRERFSISTSLEGCCLTRSSSKRSTCLSSSVIRSRGGRDDLSCQPSRESPRRRSRLQTQPVAVGWSLARRQETRLPELRWPGSNLEMPMVSASPHKLNHPVLAVMVGHNLFLGGSSLIGWDGESSSGSSQAAMQHYPLLGTRAERAARPGVSHRTADPCFPDCA